MSKFSLSDKFLSKYEGKQPKWGFGDLSYFTYKRCVTKETTILCDDLVWRPAGSLSVGQGIIGFDEEPQIVNKYQKRYLRHGVVTHNKIEKARVMGIELEDGSILYATPDHQWLSKGSSSDNRTEWRYTKDLKSTRKGFDIFLLKHFGTPWDSLDTFDHGFLSAAYDGEGCLDRLNGISFCQVQNGMLDKFISILNLENIPYTKTIKSNSTSYKYKEERQECFSLRTSGYSNVIRFLGKFQPPRLLNKFRGWLVEKSLNNSTPELRCSPENYVKVVSIFDAGEKEIAVLSTSVKTHFTGGFASHNTYSRLMPTNKQEEYFDTLKRAVEGCFQIQMDHCKQIGLPWNGYKAQISAQKMFEKMWEFKFTPPGRGLWMMGVDTLKEKKAAALQNCGFVSTKDIKKDFAKPFAWAMDMLMLGVGIGFDTKGKDTVIVSKPTGTSQDYIIPDTREGWVESMRLLLDSYTNGKDISMVFDYSKIRKAGEPIKGFGGIASGPGPLKKGHESISKLLDSLDGKEVTSVAIVDIMNFIGKLVVSGNVRRSALIAIGDAEDTYFITMKDPDMWSYELADRRWSSNNSIFVDNTFTINGIVDYISKNGEPGLANLYNMQHFGRLKDGFYSENHPMYDDADGFNPCVTADTWVMTSNGPCTVEQLYKIYLPFDTQIGDKSYKSTPFFKTGNKPVYRLCTKEGFELKLTADHKVLTTDGNWIEAQNLKKGCLLQLNDLRGYDQSWNSLNDNNHGISHGYLLGHLIGDGTINNGKPIISVWEEEGYESVISHIENICKSNFDTRSDFKGFYAISRDSENYVVEHRLTCSALRELSESYDIYQGNKTITDKIEYSSSEFYRGFLGGLFDTDGSIQGTQSKGISIRLSQADKVLLQKVQRMLLRLGIKSVIYKRREAGPQILPDGKGGNATYICKDIYELCISGDSILLFEDIICLNNSHKINKLKKLISNYKRTPNKTKYHCTFTELIYHRVEDVYDTTVEDVHRFDANGIIVHNCAEQCLESYELCNLVETYPANHNSSEEYLDTLKYAFLYAKSVTLLSTHSPETNSVMLRNRRIGVSMTGVQQALQKFGHSIFFQEFCDAGYEKVKHWDAIYSRWLGIPESKRKTTCKPSGTVSLLAGATPGVHCTHAPFYLRTVRLAANSPLLKPLQKAGYRIEVAITDLEIYVEKLINCGVLLEDEEWWLRQLDISSIPKNIWKTMVENGTTLVVYFPVEEHDFTKSKYDISVWEQLSVVRELQTNWADNAVSVTVTFKPEEKEDLKSAINFFLPYVKSLSFLPLEKHAYLQAPYTDTSREEFDKYKNSLKPLNFKTTVEANIVGEKYCSNDTCEL
jgi:intein/homing endonuclease